MELARALAGPPRLLLLDETLAGLGREECDDVLDVLARLRDEGMTIVIIEHTMHAMMRIADRFVVLDHGRVLASGLPRRGGGGPHRDRGLSRQEMGGQTGCLRSANLSVAYGGLRALTDVSLSVTEGQFVTVVGPNGAGKSTLFKTISGIVPASGGRITFMGEDLLALAPARRAHLGIAHVPEGRQVFKTLTVRENLEMGAYPKAGRDAWHHTLDRIHTLFPILAERARQLAGTLSGGEQQMVAIGRGLACAPRLLMLDEPSMGLAPAVADTIFERVSQIHREDGVTILLVEQRVAEALELSDHGYVLETGHMVLDGPTRRCCATTGCASYLGLSRRLTATESARTQRPSTETWDRPPKRPRSAAAPPWPRPGRRRRRAGRAAPARRPRPEVKIAMLVPLSGPWARQGILEQMGARMAIDDVNNAGGIKSMGGAKLKLIEYDTQDSAEKAKDAAQRMLAQEPDLVGGFGCWLSTFTLAATEVTERAELPWLTLSYSDLITGRGFKHVFQSSPTADRQAEEDAADDHGTGAEGVRQEADQGRLHRRQHGVVGQLHEADARPRGRRTRA